MDENDKTERFYYKIVAKLNSRYFSIFDGNTEFILGEALFQKAASNHQVNFSQKLNQFQFFTMEAFMHIQQ